MTFWKAKIMNSLEEKQISHKSTLFYNSNHDIQSDLNTLAFGWHVLILRPEKYNNMSRHDSPQFFNSF